ncbi:MAG: ROK family protein [Hyphomonas sp.]
MTENLRVAGIELGGTKSIALLAEGKNILHQVTVPTTTPDETLSRLRTQLQLWHTEQPFSALGIASFGPIQLNKDAPDFGTILKTPKPNWTDAPVAIYLASSFTSPWAIDTDVNGAALAEHRWGAGIGCDSLCYITIGTGLGGGVVVNGKAVHGLLHPEIGHIRVRRSAGDTFPGACPFHGDCIEGLVSGPALAARFGRPTSEVPHTHPAWQSVADDIAELACTILLTTSAQRILFGGGVSSSRLFLLPMVRQRVFDRLGGYLPLPDVDTIAGIIAPPALGDLAGPLGAVAVAHLAAGK